MHSSFILSNLYSARFLYENKNLYILCGIRNEQKKYGLFDNDYDIIKIFDLKGREIKEIKESNNDTYFICSYNDSILSKTFIITAGEYASVKVYDFDNSEIYYKYHSYSGIGKYSNVIILNSENKTKLIVPNNDGNIRIWDFHLKKLIKIIKISNDEIYRICNLEDNYLIAGGKDKIIKLIELKSGIIVKKHLNNEDDVVTFQKMEHNNYGKCLISTGFSNYPINIWRFKFDEEI